jgi:hypothetical protein
MNVRKIIEIGTISVVCALTLEPVARFVRPTQTGHSLGFRHAFGVCLNVNSSAGAETSGRNNLESV